MEAILKTGKKTIHSDYILMIRSRQKDGRVLLVFADRHSKDQFRIYLEAEEQKTIFDEIKNTALERINENVKNTITEAENLLNLIRDGKQL